MREGGALYIVHTPTPVVTFCSFLKSYKGEQCLKILNFSQLFDAYALMRKKDSLPPRRTFVCHTQYKKKVWCLPFYEKKDLHRNSGWNNFWILLNFILFGPRDPHKTIWSEKRGKPMCEKNILLYIFFSENLVTSSRILDRCKIWFLP